MLIRTTIVLLFTATTCVFLLNVQMEFHGISINNEEILLDGSEAPVRICVGGLLSSEKLVPSAILKKVKVVFYKRETSYGSIGSDYITV